MLARDRLCRRANSWIVCLASVEVLWRYNMLRHLRALARHACTCPITCVLDIPCQTKRSHICRHIALAPACAKLWLISYILRVQEAGSNELSASSILQQVFVLPCLWLLSRHSSVVYHFSEYTVLHACDRTGFLWRRCGKRICHYIVSSRNVAYIGSEYRHKHLRDSWTAWEISRLCTSTLMTFWSWAIQLTNTGDISANTSGSPL